ncbi:MAG TPA: AMP-binding protein [Turneriella sp.]|nr:AMP-binding protein [Turneriella sp.]
MRHLPDVFHFAATNFPNQGFYSKDTHKFFKSQPFRALHERASQFAIHLIHEGLKPKENVALFGDNSAEWLIVDMAIQMANAVVVPRGSDSTPQELEFILEHSEAKIVFIEHLRLYKKIAPLLKEKKLCVYVIDAAFPQKIADEDKITILPQFFKNLKPLSAAEIKQLDTLRAKLTSSDLFTIIYTSGTTGEPKGVMLTHANMLYQIEVVPTALSMSPKDRILSILPVWHIFERFMLYSVISSGAHYYYSNKKDLMEDFIRIKPTLMASAPRLWEQIYQKLREQIDKTEAFNRELFDLSYGIKQRL